MPLVLKSNEVCPIGNSCKHSKLCFGIDKDRKNIFTCYLYDKEKELKIQTNVEERFKNSSGEILHG